MSKQKPVKAWGGFLDGELDHHEIDDGWGGYGREHGKRNSLAIFTSRKVARTRYRDVRRIMIVEDQSK